MRDPARARAEKYLAEKMLDEASKPGSDMIAACVRIAADAIEKTVRAAYWQMQFPLGVSIEPDDPMAVFKLLRARDAAWKASEAGIPWHAIEDGKS